MSKSRQSHNGSNGPKGHAPNDNLSAKAQGTWPQQRSSKAQRAAKAARVHTLTDPLGARGFRATGQRVKSETSARRKVLLASVATFAASFGVIVGTNHLPSASNTAAATEPAAATTSTAATSGQAVSNDAVATNQALVDLFTGRTTTGLTSSTTSTSSATTTKQHDDGEGDDHESENSSYLSSGTNNSSSSQSTTNNQTDQSSFFVQQQPVQQPSHTRSGGS